MVVDSNFHRLPDCWFPAYLDAACRQMTAAEHRGIEAWIQVHVFDAALAERPRKMNVTTALRRFIPANPDWGGTALQPLFARTGQDYKKAAMLFGNFVCRVGVGRPEWWWSIKEAVSAKGSRTYILTLPQVRMRMHNDEVVIAVD